MLKKKARTKGQTKARAKTKKPVQTVKKTKIESITPKEAFKLSKELCSDHFLKVFGDFNGCKDKTSDFDTAALLWNYQMLYERDKSDARRSCVWQYLYFELINKLKAKGIL